MVEKPCTAPWPAVSFTMISQIGIIRNVCELHDQRTIADFVLHRFRNLADQMRIVAQQTIMSLIPGSWCSFPSGQRQFRQPNARW